MKKYYDTPSKYDVDSTSLSCGNYWYIEIDVNDKNLVQVYLGDLSCLPYNEQLHWRHYNTLPDGGITQSRRNRDFYGQFVDSADIMFQFRKSLTKFQQKFESKFKFKLFLPLKPNDTFVDQSIRIPLNNEVNEFEQQILYLAKLLPDSINTNSIIKSEDNIDPSLIKLGKKNLILECFLTSNSLNTNIVSNLHKIQNIRSTGVAHRKGDKYENMLEKYGFEENTYAEFSKN